MSGEPLEPRDLIANVGADTFTLTVPGEAVAQGRPRFAVINGHARAYDPPKSRKYKEVVRDFAARAWGDAAPVAGPVEVALEFWFPRPVSSWRKRAPLGVEPKITKPDIENLAKGVLDAMSGVVYHDDKQVWSLKLSKMMTRQGDGGSVDICVRWQP